MELDAGPLWQGLSVPVDSAVTPSVVKIKTRSGQRQVRLRNRVYTETHISQKITRGPFKRNAKS